MNSLAGSAAYNEHHARSVERNKHENRGICRLGVARGVSVRV
jgi:hypothetical protein